MNLNDIKKECLVLDIETSAFSYEGNPIDIRTDFEEYVKRADVKWIGMYSYKNNEYIVDVVKGNEERILNYISQHKIIIGFNSESFDVPILSNNDLMPDKRFLQVDCMQILGASNFYSKSGASFKNRGALMGFKYKKNSLKSMAEVMKLDTLKGDIDYKIFHKTEWTPQEVVDIKKYLRADVEVTK